MPVDHYIWFLNSFARNKGRVYELKEVKNIMLIASYENLNR